VTVILFDLDGTLIDSTEAIVESFGAAFDAFGQTAPSRERIVSMIGAPLEKMFTALGVAESEAARYVAAYKTHYKKISTQKTRLLPGAEEAVCRAASFARLGVVTTKTGLYSRILLEHLGLMAHFETLVGSEDVTHHKPHPEPVFKALARMGVQKGDIWLVGDTPMDVEAAINAKISPFAVTCGYASAETLEKAAPNIASDALEAVLAIEKRKSLL